ncbi:MAG: GTPase Era [Chloroflexota bacterium]|nr:MAG: GTPase Era [Chloroflexota bacterium]
MNDSELDSIFRDDWPEDHRSGVVAVVGKPNVGKSTLINQILGQKVAAVTPKPQTTRRNQLGIYTVPEGQILFVDTPGMHQPVHKLGEWMVRDAERALKDADVILLLLDVSQLPDHEDRNLVERLKRLKDDTPLFLALNKADALKPGQRESHVSAHADLIEHDGLHVISALNGDGVRQLIDALMALMPLGPRYYPEDQVTEVNLRTVAAEIIREKVMLNTEQEIPHATAVEVESFQERDENMTYISAVIYVERDSQKGIVIGKNGSLIKKIGAEARAEIEPLVGTPVYLDLRVKVLPNWRTDDRLMSRLGFKTGKERKGR